MNIKIIFVDDNKENIEALKKFFGDLYNVQFLKGNIVEITQADCIVYPGDSYVTLVDNNNHNKTINILFKNTIDQIRNIVHTIYYGEIPISNCILQNTFTDKYHYICYSPIIRYDDSNKNINTYLCFRAILTTIINHNKINDNKIHSIICPSLITNNITTDEAARQMRIAYNQTDLGLYCNKENAKFIYDLLN